MPPKAPKIPLPNRWNNHVKSAVLHAISLARFAATAPAKKNDEPTAATAELERLRQEILLLREEIRIKDARLASISVHKRPRYSPVERLAILELRAARGWSLQQTPDAFLLTAQTISSWNRRVDESGPDALVRTAETVNKFPQHVAQLVRKLKTLCPQLGKQKIAEKKKRGRDSFILQDASEEEKGTRLVYSAGRVRGRPRGRRESSIPKHLAIRRCQRGRPNG